MTKLTAALAATLSVALLSSTPALAADAQPAPAKKASHCKAGGFSKVKSFLLAKDEAGVTRLQRWALTTAGVAVLGAATVTVTGVGAAVVAAPGCFSSPTQCRATLMNPRENSPLFQQRVPGGATTR